MGAKTLRKSSIDDWAKVAPPNVVMEWATHSSLNTPMKYYSKVSPGDEQIGQVKMFKSAFVKRHRLFTTARSMGRSIVKQSPPILHIAGTVSCTSHRSIHESSCR